jgi:hypothetical protein
MFCHIGNGPDLLGPLWKVVKETQIPIQTFLPTHMERSEALINDGVNWVKAGGYVDFSCRTLKVSPPPSVCVFLSLSLSLSLSLCICLSSLSVSVSLFPASESARHNRRVFFRPCADLLLSILWWSNGCLCDCGRIRMMQCRLALKKFDLEGLPLEQVMVSSDSYGSIPTFDEDGNLVKYSFGKTKAFLQFLFKMYFQDMWPLEKILPLMTSNPASFLKLKGKGKLEVGSDADILLLDKNTLKLKSVIAKGRVVMTPKWTHQGMFGG